MKMIMMYPIQPDANGASYEIEVGAVFLHVTEKCGHYYLHALVDTSEENHEIRSIAGYCDHQIMPDNAGWYIGSAPCSYHQSQVGGRFAIAFHFFDQTKRGPK